MPYKIKYNLDFRPSSYFSSEEIPEEKTSDEFSEDQQEENYKIFSPGGFIWANGENLPPIKRNEIEIARIEMKSAAQDVISIRARFKRNRIHYQIVDENNIEICFDPQKSNLPLTMGELISLIDNADFLGEEFGKGLTNAIRNYNLEETEDPKELINFVTVTSDFYPEFEGYYSDEAVEWLTRVNNSIA